MSVNVKTANGLLEIGGKVTKEKVISALGYSPANESHAKDTNVHITPQERTAWNNKSDFSGDYNDLENAPVQEDESGEVVYTDESGNIIAKFDSDGLSTTNVNTKTLNLNGEDLDSRLKGLESKSDNIVENESGDFVLADEDGNVIMKVDAEGMHSTEAELDGIKVRETLVKHNNHVGDTEIHVTAEEKLAWTNKSGFSGDYNDLTNAPDIQENESGEVVYADEAGNVIAKIGEAGLETTKVTANEIAVGGTDVGSHVRDEDIHVTAAEKAAWNDKKGFSGDYNDLTNAPIQEDESGEVVYADDNGHIIAKVGSNGLETTQVTAKSVVVNGSEVGSHMSDANVHVTAAEKAAWNSNKGSFSGDYNDLRNAPNIKEDNSGEVIYADDNGHIIAKIYKDGLETTTIIVDTITLRDVVTGNTYFVQMQNGTLVSFSKALSVHITTPPTKSSYGEGEEFDPTGMVITAICEDGSTREVTLYTYSMEGNIVTIIYKEGRYKHTLTLDVTKIYEIILIDFEYTDNGDGTYTLTGWKETLNGIPSTEMVIPDNEYIVL